jgi:putative membrane protein
MKILNTLPIIFAVTLVGSASFAEDQSKHSAQDFATKAASANMFESEAAKIEVKKGKDGAAKQFATDMLEDHGKAGPELEAAAKKDGVVIPSSIDPESKKKLAALESSDSANLDQAYLSTQLTAHQDAVKLFEEYAKTGPDGQLKNAAAKILPDLRMHLVRVQGLTSK